MTQAQVAEQQKIEQERQAAMKELGPAGAGLEAVLDRREREAIDKEERNLKIALVKAGLRTMAGTSGNIIRNIALGGEEGVASYQAGLKDLEKAAEARDEMRARLEEVRRAEAKGDITAATQAKKEVAQLKAQGDKFKYDAIQKIQDRASQVGLSLAEQSAANDRALYSASVSRDREERADRNFQIRAINAELATYKPQLANLEKQFADINPYSTKGKEERAALQTKIDALKDKINFLTLELQDLRPDTRRTPAPGSTPAPGNLGDYKLLSVTPAPKK
jgi:chromosome segregation ATPase